eukprot:1008971-Amorphochlora_amoeboformis.AAC.1
MAQREFSWTPIPPSLLSKRYASAYPMPETKVYPFNPPEISPEEKEFDSQSHGSQPSDKFYVSSKHALTGSEHPTTCFYGQYACSHSQGLVPTPPSSSLDAKVSKLRGCGYHIHAYPTTSTAATREHPEISGKLRAVKKMGGGILVTILSLGGEGRKRIVLGESEGAY